eukprot:UN07938
MGNKPFFGKKSIRLGLRASTPHCGSFMGDSPLILNFMGGVWILWGRFWILWGGFARNKFLRGDVVWGVCNLVVTRKRDIFQCPKLSFRKFCLKICPLAERGAEQYVNLKLPRLFPWCPTRYKVGQCRTKSDKVGQCRTKSDKVGQSRTKSR